jgi:hypothetical protein
MPEERDTLALRKSLVKLRNVNYGQNAKLLFIFIMYPL